MGWVQLNGMQRTMPLAMRDNKRARTERAGNPTANRPKKTTLNFDRAQSAPIPDGLELNYCGQQAR